MSTEDLTTYTEVDPNNHIDATAARCTWTNLGRNEDAYRYKDKGVDHFDADFEHLIDVNGTSVSATWGQDFIWGLANLVDDVKGIDDANGDELCVFVARVTSTQWRLYLVELYQGAWYETYYSIASGTTYYLKIKRDEAVGTYGTLYCYIYSDAARTTLLTTLTLTLHGKKDFRYVYATQTHNSGETMTITGYCENLDLQEAAVAFKGSRGYILG